MHDLKPLEAAAAPPRDRKGWILDVVDGMPRGGAVSMIFDDHPVPLLDWLAGVRFGEFSASFRPGPPGRWVVGLTKR